jgi:hypothetical protein
MTKIIGILTIVLNLSIVKAQSRPNIDTVSLFNLQPGISATSIYKFTKVPIDTLFWDNNSGTGILKFSAQTLDIKGEVRLSCQNGNINQVLFVVTVTDAVQSKQMFDRLRNIYTNIYGDPDIDYYNVFREVRWDGLKRSIGIKTQDGSSFVTLVLQDLKTRK